MENKYLMTDEQAEQMLDSSGAEIVERAPQSAGVPPDVLDRYQGGVVSSIGLQTDTANSQLAGKLPTFRLMPATIAGNPAQAAAVQSQIKQVPSGGSGGAAKVELTMPSEFAVDTTTSTTEEDIDVTWVSEKPGTVFSGPPANLVGFDAAFGEAGALSPSGTFPVVTTGGEPSGSPEWALYCGQCSGGVFLADPTGWTPLSGDGSSTPQLVLASIPAAGVSVSQTFSGIGAWATNLIYFGGALPTFVQSITGSSGGTNTCTLTLPASTTLGNTLFIVIGSSVGMPGGPPPQGGSGVYSFSDSQGLSAVLAVNTAASYSAIWGSGAQSVVMIAAGLVNTTETVTITSSVENSFNVTLYETTPLGPISARPRFRTPLPPDLSDATGVLGLASGGTGAIMSGTGGTNYVVQQTSPGAALSAAQLSAHQLTEGAGGIAGGAVVLANGILGPATAVNVVSAKGACGAFSSPGGVGDPLVVYALATTGGSSKVVFDVAPTISGAVNLTGSLQLSGTSSVLSLYKGAAVGGLPIMYSGGGITSATLVANVGSFTAAALANATVGNLIRVSFNMFVNRAATVSSTLPDIKFSWTDNDTNTAMTQSFTAASPSANTPGTGVQGSFLIVLKSGTFLTAQTGSATAYASSGATAMQYSLYVRSENL